MTPFAEPIVEHATNMGIMKANGPNILLANSWINDSLVLFDYLD